MNSSKQNGTDEHLCFCKHVSLCDFHITLEKLETLEMQLESSAVCGTHDDEAPTPCCTTVRKLQ